MAIRLLDSEVIGKIAAGEVVERPVSVVKELVENALDAGARSINVDIMAGGCDLIRIADDGTGIIKADLLLAIERHATSKIRTAEDLASIASLGFRGEALASIAAVSDLTIASRRAVDPSGHQLRAIGGVPGEVEHVSRSAGTTVTVERLFFNVPARRKFLKSASAEAGQIATLLSHFALAYPEVRFDLTVDGRRSLSTPGSGSLLEAAVATLGSGVAGSLVPVEAVVNADRPVVGVAARISGYVADPKVNRATRSSIWIFVNRRPIRNRSLSHAVEEGFETLLQVGRYPVAVINLEVPNSEVDVNVHPSKSEVRLLRERLIYGGLRDAVRSAVAAGSGWAKELSVERSWIEPESPSPVLSRLLDAPLSSSDTGNETVVGGRKLPILRVVGQIAQTYIIAEGESGLYLIDQHAAHERVLLEKLTKSMDSGGETQLLLEPLVVELSEEEWQVLSTFLEDLEALGYRLERFGDRTALIRGVPANLPEGRAAEILRESLEELAQEKPAGDWRQRLAIALSCRGAVKAGQTLASEEMRSLILSLEEMDITQHCSHGRPTAILLSRTQLEREFGRR